MRTVQAGMWEKAGALDEAESAYMRITRARPKTTKGQVLVAKAHLWLGNRARLTKHLKNSKRHFQRVITLFEKLGPEKSPKVPAEADFRMIEWRVNRFMIGRISCPAIKCQQKELKALIKSMREHQDRLSAFMSRWKSDEYKVAAMYLYGATCEHLARVVEDLPTPNGLSAQEAKILEKMTSKHSATFEDKAVSIWKDAMKVARRMGITGDWTAKLNQL